MMQFQNKIFFLNCLVLSMMNPFSDSDEFQIHRSHILSVGSMHFEYVDAYYEAVERIEKNIIEGYDKMVDSETFKSDSIYVDNVSEILS